MHAYEKLNSCSMNLCVRNSYRPKMCNCIVIFAVLGITKFENRKKAVLLQLRCNRAKNYKGKSLIQSLQQRLQVLNLAHFPAL